MNFDELDKRLGAVKTFILNFERDFSAKHGRKPSKEEISRDGKLRNYYKFYSHVSKVIKKSQGSTTSVAVAQETESAQVTTSAWGSSLNKANNPVAATGPVKNRNKLEDSDSFVAASFKIKRLTTVYNENDPSAKRPTAFSIRNRRAELHKKSYEVSEEFKQNPLIPNFQGILVTEEGKEERVGVCEDSEIPTTPQKCVNHAEVVSTYRKNLFQPSAEDTADSLFESIANDTTVSMIDDEDFDFDDLNTFIHDSIINNDENFITTTTTSTTSKRSVYNIDEDQSESLFKRRRHEDPESTERRFINSSRSAESVVKKSAQDLYEFDDFTEEEFMVTKLPTDVENVSTNILEGQVQSEVHGDIIVKEPAPLKKPEKEIKIKKTTVPKGNFRRLSMKRGKFTRGPKGVNMRKYKFQTWSSNKRKAKEDGNTCFQCGEAGHWANQCTNSVNLAGDGPTIDSTEVNDEDEIDDVETKPKIFAQPRAAVARRIFDDLDDPELDSLVDEALKEFGFEEFRPNQKLTVKRILCGRSTLLISPTGFGKSLCYQLAAYCFWKKRQWITVVISPLISLMQDQILNFPKGITPVAYNSSMKEKEKDESLSALVYGKAQVLFLSPESVVGGSGFSSIGFETLSRIAFVCVDEAHCLAEWSTNFRPSYLHLFRILNDRFSIKNFLALTATATKETQRMVCKNLSLSHPEDVVGQTSVPENLILSVSRNANKLNTLIELLKKPPFSELKSLIIYCTKRDQTEQLVGQIRTLLQFNMNKTQLDSLCSAYHAGLGSYERAHIQKQFISGKLRIIVATIAFGMGINKKNIRGVIHYNLPKSFESYVQEIGRAGRDNKPAYCHLMLDSEGEDLFALQSYVYGNGIDRISLKKLAGKIYPACQCQKLRALLEEDDAERDEIKCPSHPVALPITITEADVDIKSESIYTILMALELSNNVDVPKVQCFPPTNSGATVVNYGEHSDMNRLIDQSKVLQMAVHIAKQEMGKMFDLNSYKFCLMKLAKAMGMTVSQVRQELRALNWRRDEITGKMKRSTLNIRYDTFSYYFKARGDLEDPQFEKIIDYLAEAIAVHEKKEIFKLRLVYSKFNEFVLNFKDQEENEQEFNEHVIRNSDRLKQFLNDYFQSEWQAVEDYDSTKLKLPYSIVRGPENIGDIELQVSNLISIHYGQGLNTPRKLARILQGMSSPKFPAEIWGKVRDFWRSTPNVDFPVLLDVCAKQLSTRYSYKLPKKSATESNSST